MDNGAGSYRRFLDGDETGIVELVRDYRDGLILYLNGFTQDLCAAEELTEETFVRLVVRRPRFSGRSSFKTWLYAIGRNMALDFLRRRSRAAEVPIEDAEAVRGDEESLERAYIREERKLAVHRALKKLKPDYRQVLWLTCFEGFDNAEAAAVMKKNRRQVENLAYRAKQALKAQLLKEDICCEDL